MALRAMKYNELSHIIFPGKQEASRSLGNPTAGLKVFQLSTGTIYLLVLDLIETLNKIH